jgi:hypothetical protein
MHHLPDGPTNLRLIRPKRLPQALRDSGVALVEQKLSNGTVKIADKAQRVTLIQLQVVGATTPCVVGQRA